MGINKSWLVVSSLHARGNSVSGMIRDTEKEAIELAKQIAGDNPNQTACVFELTHAFKTKPMEVCQVQVSFADMMDPAVKAS